MISDNSLLEDRERLRMALEAAGVGVWDHDLETGQLIWSRRCYELLGVPETAVPTFKDFLNAIHPDDRERVQDFVARVLRHTEGDSLELEYRTTGLNDRKQRWIKASGKAYFDANGVPLRLIGTVTDISQQKFAEQELQASEQKFRLMANQAPVIVWLTNRAGKVIYLNQRWTEVTGQSSEAAAGYGWTEAVHPDDRQFAHQTFLDASLTRSPFQLEYRLRYKDGTDHWVLDSARPRFDATGGFEGYIGSVTEITDLKQAEESLRLRTALLEAQHDATGSGLLSVNKEGRIIYYNQRFLDIWELPADSIRLMNYDSALAKALELVNDPKSFVERINYLQAHPQELPDEIVLRNGRVLQRTLRPIVDSEGKQYGWLWQFDEITEFRSLIKELELKHALFEAQNEGSPLGILGVNQNKEIYYMNRRYVELFNIPEEAARNRDRQAIFEVFKRTVKNYEAFAKRIEYLYANQEKGGSRDEVEMVDGRIIERYSYPIRGKDGKSLGWTWQFKDITEQRAAAEILEQKNRELEQLIEEFKFVTDFMPQMVWATRPDGYHEFFNRRWADYTGIPIEEIKAAGWQNVLHPDDRPRIIEQWRHSMATGADYQIEFRMRRKDGVYRWFLCRATPIRNERGEIEKWFGTSTDIQDQKTANDLLEQKVAERTLELQEINARLEQSNLELEQFAYVASHDLQEPLRKIRTFTNMLQGELKKEQPEKVDYLIDRIWSSSSRMQELIRDLLDFSKLNRAEQYHFEKTDLNSIIRQVKEDLELAILQKNAEISCDELPTVQGNPLQISQLFFNLLSNAIKFSKPGVPPKVHVQCSAADASLLAAHNLPLEAGGYHHITVSDNGIGFDPEYAQQIFTIFQRLHTRTTYEGTGIGLALCKKVILNHHGAIWATSAPGKGATFHVLLPNRSPESQ